MPRAKSTSKRGRPSKAVKPAATKKKTVVAKSASHKKPQPKTKKKTQAITHFSLADIKSKIFSAVEEAKGQLESLEKTASKSIEKMQNQMDKIVVKLKKAMDRKTAALEKFKAKKSAANKNMVAKANEALNAVKEEEKLVKQQLTKEKENLNSVKSEGKYLSGIHKVMDKFAKDFLKQSSKKKSKSKASTKAKKTSPSKKSVKKATPKTLHQHADVSPRSDQDMANMNSFEQVEYAQSFSDKSQ